MDPEDEVQSPTRNGRIAVTVSGYASQPSSNSITLALPIQKEKNAGSGLGGGGGGGREDCWTEEATAILIEAWGERYLELSRGNLKQKHWKDVAEIVNSSDGFNRNPKTDIQCKNRIDTVKKKYKTEKAKVMSGFGPSKWRFFDRLDELIVPTGKISAVPHTTNTDRLTRSSAQKPSRRRAPVKFDDESESENSDDSSEVSSPRISKKPRPSTGASLRPCVMNKTSDFVGRNKNERSSWSSSLVGLTQTLLRFAEAYEQVENEKLQQLVEMEKQRMKFTKELELQRMQCLMETQMELSQLKSRRPKNKD